MNENLLWCMLLESNKSLSRQRSRCSLSQRVAVLPPFLHRTSVVHVNLFVASTTYGPCWTESASTRAVQASPQPSLSPLKSAPSLKPASLVACPALKVCCIPSVFLSLPVRSASLLVWSFWLIFSLIPLLLEFHEVWFSGALVVYWFQIGCYPPFGCVRK